MWLHASNYRSKAAIPVALLGAVKVIYLFPRCYIPTR